MKSIQDSNYALDDIDKKILNILQEDCRTTAKEISEKLSLPKTTIYYRIKRLEKENIIEGYHAKVNTEKLGMDFYMIIHVRAKYGKGYDNKIGESLSKIPGVWGVFFVFGDNDFIVLARGNSREALVEKIQTMMGMEDIERTSTSIVANTFKLDQRMFFEFIDKIQE